MNAYDTWMLGLPGGCIEDDPADWNTLQSIIGEADIPVEVDDSYFPQSTYTDNGDGSRTAQGWIKVIWRFKITHAWQREALRAYCPGLSADVYLRTHTNEYNVCIEEYDWISLRGQMCWPIADEAKDGRFVSDLEFEFRACTEVP